MKTFYDKWLNNEPGFTNQGSFCVSLMKTYLAADGTNRERLADAYPEYFKAGKKEQLKEVVIYLSDEIRADLLCSAIEGGSNYWYYLPDISMCDKYKTKGERVPLVDLIMKAILAGEKIPVTDREEDDCEKDGEHRLGYISMENIKRGEQLMFEKHVQDYADAKDENHDANTADIWLQLCVMGEIVYG